MISTGTGDKGETSLGDGSRVKKDDIRVNSYGCIDEANSFLGLFLSMYNGEVSDKIKRIQKELFVLGSDISTPLEKSQVRITNDHLKRLEDDIQQLESSLPELKKFILPGGSKEASILHIARSTIRRAERSLTHLYTQDKINKVAFVYLNRLSDLLFLLARNVNKEAGKNEEEVDIRSQ